MRGGRKGGRKRKGGWGDYLENSWKVYDAEAELKRW